MNLSAPACTKQQCVYWEGWFNQESFPPSQQSRADPDRRENRLSKVVLGTSGRLNIPYPATLALKSLAGVRCFCPF